MNTLNEATQALTFAVSDDGTAQLMIAHPAGRITVQGWDQSHIEVSRAAGDTTYADLPGDVDLAELLETRQEGNAITIKPVRVPDEWLARLRHRSIRDLDDELITWERKRRAGCLALDIRVPHQCTPTVHTASGDIIAYALQGALNLQSASGNIALRDIAGQVSVQSASGVVGLCEVRGKLGLRTVSGDLDIRQSELAALRVDTVSGAVAAQVAWQPGGDYAFHTVSGDVTLALPAETGAEVAFQTFSGGFQCALPHQRKHSGGGHRVRLNGGGPLRIEIHTLSGSARIQASGASATAPPAPAPGPSPEMSILDALERGDISLDDGLAALTALAH